MKRFQLLITAILLVYSITAQNVSINNDGSTPHSSAMLEVKSSTKGFLPPRMTSSEIFSISNPAEGLMVYNLNTNKPAFHNGSQWSYFDGTLMSPSVGDFIQGGVVFYVDGSGGGMVCAVSDQSTGAGWGCGGTGIPGADGTAIGTGAQNTADIVAGCSTTGIAAYICDTLTLNGYTDWFLPSKDELNEMYTNRTTINTTALANGGASFAGGKYWSSSEHSAANAWAHIFFNGFTNDFVKSEMNYVRAVREF